MLHDLVSRLKNIFGITLYFDCFPPSFRVDRYKVRRLKIISAFRFAFDFPEALQLTENRIAFKANEIEEWVSSRPREKGPEVNDNKRRVRCPQTPSELEEARLQDYAEMKAKKQGDGA